MSYKRGQSWGKDTAKLFAGLFSLMFFYVAYTGLAFMAGNAIASVGSGALGAAAATPAGLKVAAAQSVPAVTAAPATAPALRLPSGPTV